MTNPGKKNKLRILVLLLIAVCAACCAVFYLLKARTDKKEEPGALYRIYCTTYPVYLFTRQVLEDIPDVSVHLLLPPDTGCPHDYTLTPKDLMKLSYEQTCLVCNGQGLDDAICDAVRQTYPDLLIIDASRQVEHLIPYTEEDEHEEEAAGHEEEEAGENRHHHHHHEKGACNPHFFASPSTADDMVREIRDAFTRIAPAHAAKFRANTETLLQELGRVSEEYRKAVKHFKTRKVAVQHDVFSYLARDFGLEEAVVMKMDEHQTLSPRDISRLADTIREQKVKVIFTEPQYQSKYAEVVAREAGILCDVLDPVATGPKNPPDGYYISVMRKNLATLKKYLDTSIKK